MRLKWRSAATPCLLECRNKASVGRQVGGRAISIGCSSSTAYFEFLIDVRNAPPSSFDQYRVPLNQQAQALRSDDEVDLCFTTSRPEI